MILLTIGAWNVRTLVDSTGSDRPQRRKVLADRELYRYKVEIAALSENRLAEEGLLKEVCAGYSFFWSGHKKEERPEAGVGFAIVTPCQQALTTSKRHTWSPDDAETSLFWQEACNNCKWSAYAPTMTNPDEVKDKFYDDLDSMISATTRTDKLILLGDFNARVGTDHQTWEGEIGTEGIGKCNSYDLLLLRKYAEHDHQHSLPSTNSQQDITYAFSLQTLASHLLCHIVKEEQTGCQSDKDYVWCRLLDRLQACYQQTQPAHSTCLARKYQRY